MGKFEPNRIISLQISYISEATVANFQNNEFRVVIKH